MNALDSRPTLQRAKEKLIDPVRRAVFEAVYRDYLPLSYCDTPNWGDALSPVLCGKLSGRPIKKVLWHHQRRYLAIGSILGNASRTAEVWGSGFVWPDEKLPEPPQAIHAVRGPRTRTRLRALGYDCPEVYGDPALLFPYFFNPPVEKKYAVGVIPHFSDKGVEWIKRLPPDPAVRLIDVEGGIEEFVRAVKSCELIISSSLHGLICADAYGVPNLWVKLSDILWGGAFKFTDYFESVGRPAPTPVVPDLGTSVAAVTAHYRHETPRIDLSLLIKACPFISADVRRKVFEATVSLR